MAYDNKITVQQKLLDHRIIAFLAAILTIVASFLLIPAFSPSNDDAYIEQSLAGTGGVSAYPTPYTTTVNILLGALVSALYRIFSYIRWWPLLQLVLIFLALCSLGSTLIVLERTENVFSKCKGRSRVVLELLGLVIVELGIAGALISRLQFTSTASLLISVTIFTLCVRNPNKNESFDSHITTALPSIILAIFGFAYRSQSGYLGYFFWVFAALGGAFLTSENNYNKRRSIQTYLVPVLVVVILSGVMNFASFTANNLSSNPTTSVFSGFSRLVDYPRPSFSENPELYEDAGWDESLTVLVGKWFMMDDRINAESLDVINSANANYAFTSLCNDPAGVLSNRLQGFVQPLVMAYFSLYVLLASCNISYIKKDINSLITIILAVLPLVFLTYLLFQGRLIERAVLAILLPAIAANSTVFIRNISIKVVALKGKATAFIALIFSGIILLPLINLASSNLSKAIGVLPIVFSAGSLFNLCINNNLKIKRAGLSPRQIIKDGLCMMSVLSVMLPMIAAIRIYGWDSSIAAKQFYQLDNTRAFFSYVDEHPNTIYIYSDAQITMQYLGLAEWPENQTGWGGWRYSYIWFDDAMRELGLEGRPTSDDFLKSNVRFVSASEDTSNLLLRYMQNRFGSSVEMRQVDSITDEIKVYEFTIGQN